MIIEINREARTLSGMKPGAHIHPDAIEFIVHSRANRLWLLLFDTPDAASPSREIEMAGGPLWRAVVPGLKPGAFYLYKTDAVPEQWLLDPYARAVHTPRAWGEAGNLEPKEHLRTGPEFPKGIVTDGFFDWQGTRKPATPLGKTVIYEAHLRGFTRDEADGTWLDLIGKIPYLLSLGITAVELLPVFEFNELEFYLEGSARKNLRNFWGYSTRAFFAPMSRYAASREPGAAVTEFKTLVRELHKAGIEIILDVVFNHTAEGPFNGPVYSFRGLDEPGYYMISHDGSYPNWSGCGNTFNCNHPVVRQLITDCLAYWADEMQVDGFRFDLATVLCRDEQGNLLQDPPLIRDIEAEPALRNVKLIAEAWDALGGYQVGSFPGKRFSDWNGLFRDDVRRFWNQGGGIGPLATRLAGSSDLYQRNGGSPLKSINFITAHDGYTLADLVSYERKHNLANCEENRDGENHNYSINFGEEGPSADPQRSARRLQQQKNLLATLMLSRGVPMLTAGDEFGRTQLGNNNAYCQDNGISWIDWTLAEKNEELIRFTQQLIALRKRHPALCSGEFYTGKGDVEWFGEEGRPVDWHFGRALGMHIKGRKGLLILINNNATACRFILPKGPWNLALTTGRPAGKPDPKGREMDVPAGTLCIFE